MKISQNNLSDTAYIFVGQSYARVRYLYAAEKGLMFGAALKSNVERVYSLFLKIFVLLFVQ